MNEHTKYKYTDKIKGMFLNFNIDKTYIDNTIPIFRKLNLISLGRTQQSIHHINYNHTKKGDLKNIQINFRPRGIKPEDIDGFMLEKKKEKKELSNYEQILYGMWLCHYKKNKTNENKIQDSIMKSMHKLKCKWTNTQYTPLKTMPKEYIDELTEESKDIIMKITKYEVS